MSNTITGGVDISKLLLKSVYDPAGLESISAHNHRRYAHKYVASNTLQGSNDAVVSTSSTGFVKVKTLRLNYLEAGTIRISFDLYNQFSNGTTFGQIRRNGTNIGTERSMVGTTPTTYTQDFNMSLFTERDHIELWIRTTDVGRGARARNFRIKHDIIIAEREMYTPV